MEGIDDLKKWTHCLAPFNQEVLLKNLFSMGCIIPSLKNSSGIRCSKNNRI